MAGPLFKKSEGGSKAVSVAITLGVVLLSSVAMSLPPRNNAYQTIPVFD